MEREFAALSQSLQTFQSGQQRDSDKNRWLTVAHPDWTSYVDATMYTEEGSWRHREAQGGTA